MTKTYYQDGLVMPAHAHNFTSISIVLGGRLSEKVGSRTVVGGSVQTIIKPSGVMHENFFSKDSYVLSLALKETDFLNTRKFEVLEEWDWFAGLESIGFFSGLLKCSNENQQADILRHWMQYLSGNVERSTGMLVPPWLLEVKDYLDQHFHDEVRSDFLAEMFNVHRVYLARAFRKYFGASVKEYLNALRVHNATGAVVMHEESLTRIALENGFSDQSHFNRHFKKATAITPSELRALTKS
ncbi:MAG: helix-turn-helix transcriptional regulator [Roseivirga sp.]|nr:helix-turn-helix transcriptional regulator [Roseivirga sp.]